MSRIKKAVFPVAGLGTRFLPATKATPKEMLPIVDKPLIQYAVEEAVAAGVEELVFITSSAKRPIEDHFDKNFELESILEHKGKDDLLRQVKNVVPEDVACIYVRQPEALGLGHAVNCAAPVIDGMPFAVSLADDLIADGPRGVMRQMAELYEEHRCSILGVEEVPADETHKYGIVSTGERLDDQLAVVTGMVEKPTPAEAPSNLAVVGRYILTPRIFHHLRNVGRGSGGEIQLTDAIAALLKEEKVLAYRFKGKRYDCGSQLGYLQATVEYGLQHDGVGDAFREYLEGTFCIKTN